MFDKYDKKASDLQSSVWSTDCYSDIDFEESKVRRAVVHARMDIVLLYSHLSSANKQLRVIKYILAMILITLMYAVYRSF